MLNRRQFERRAHVPRIIERAKPCRQIMAIEWMVLLVFESKVGFMMLMLIAVFSFPHDCCKMAHLRVYAISPTLVEMLWEADSVEWFANFVSPSSNHRVSRHGIIMMSVDQGWQFAGARTAWISKAFDTCINRRHVQTCLQLHQFLLLLLCFRVVLEINGEVRWFIYLQRQTLIFYYSYMIARRYVIKRLFDRHPHEMLCLTLNALLFLV